MGGTPIIDAKIAIPAPHRYSVDRSGAWAMVGRGQRVGLTVVSAGPGFLGRELVASWARSGSEHPVAWLSLDGDDDPARLLVHVVATIRAVDAGFAPDLDVDALIDAGPGWHGRAIDALIAELDCLTAPMTVVLDGAHRLVQSESKRRLETLIRYRPAQLRIIVITCDDAALDLSGAALSGSAVEIGESLLALDLDQTYRAVAATGVEATTHVAAALHAATEGWPAGVFFAAKAAAERDEAPVFAADAERVLQYLRARIAEVLEPDLLRFFLRIAPLGDVSAELCAAVTERTDVGRLLGRLHELHLVSSSAAGLRTGWYRVPAHLSTFARHELRAADAGVAAEMCRRAAHWCWEHELLEESMRIASGGQDIDLMTQILLEHHHAWSAGGQAAAVRRWCAVLLQHEPGLVEAQLAAAWASLFLADDAAANSAAALIATLNVPGDRGTFVRGELSMLAAHVARRRGEMIRSMEATEAGVAAARSLPDDFVTGYRGALPGALVLHIGVASVWGDDLPGAIAALDAARAETGWSRHALPAIHGHLAVAHWLRDDDAAYAHAEVAVTHLRPDALGAAEFIALCMGLILEVDADFDLLAPALALADQIDEPVARVMAAVAEVFCVADRDRPRALERVRVARAEVESCPEPGALSDVLARAARRVGADRDPVLGDPLTAGETRVLRMLGGSLTEREIASELHLSHNTVRTYRRRLYRKLGVASRSDAARIALERPPA